MRIVLNNIIPFRGFLAITLWPFIFVREAAYSRFTDRVLRHELIHGRQQVELLLVGFYLWYGVEWLVRLVQHRNAHRAYRAISFEREAYTNESVTTYLSDRRHFAWLRYL